MERRLRILRRAGVALMLLGFLLGTVVPAGPRCITLFSIVLGAVPSHSVSNMEACHEAAVATVPVFLALIGLAAALATFSLVLLALDRARRRASRREFHTAGSS